MWKREENAHAPELPETLAPIREPGPASAPTAPRARASIGRSITIRGEVTGEEDLIIEGLEDGASFRGAVDMGDKSEGRAAVASAPGGSAPQARDAHRRGGEGDRPLGRGRAHGPGADGALP